MKQPPDESEGEHHNSSEARRDELLQEAVREFQIRLGLETIRENRGKEFRCVEFMTHEEFMRRVQNANRGGPEAELIDVQNDFSTWQTTREKIRFGLIFLAYQALPPVAAITFAICARTWLALLLAVPWRVGVKAAAASPGNSPAGCAICALVIGIPLAIWRGPADLYVLAFGMTAWGYAFFQVAERYGKVTMWGYFTSHPESFVLAQQRGMIKVAVPSDDPFDDDAVPTTEPRSSGGSKPISQKRFPK